MKYCQGPKCHEHRTKDRIRGPKGDKHYETRKRTSFYYGNDNFCDQRCMYEWFELHGQRAIDHCARLHEPKRMGCDSAWYKDCKYNYNNGNHHRYDCYFVNDLLGERRSITEQEYNNKELTQPS